MLQKNADVVLKALSDEELLSFVEDCQKLSVPKNSIVRKVINDVFGKENIVVLQINELLWPMLLEVSERMKHYSPHTK